jgi:hypothetical protein
MDFISRARANARAAHRATDAYLEAVLTDAAPISFERTASSGPAGDVAAPVFSVAAGPHAVFGTGLPSADHCIQLYWRDSQIVTAVADFTQAGLEAGETIVVIATRAHRRALEATLALRDHDLVGERYTAIDAEKALDALLDGGAIDPDRFARTVGRLIRDLVGERRPVRIYGEMVGLLWGDGDVVGAMHLEALWNELRVDVPFALLCGYGLHSGDNRSWLDALCRLHGGSAAPPG